MLVIIIILFVSVYISYVLFVMYNTYVLFVFILCHWQVLKHKNKYRNLITDAAFRSRTKRAVNFKNADEADKPAPCRLTLFPCFQFGYVTHPIIHTCILSVYFQQIRCFGIVGLNVHFGNVEL